MAKVIAPLFGFSARGKLDKSLIYSSWKGINYVKKYVTPANPKTPAQVAHRNLFSQAVSSWKSLADDEKSAWNNAAKGKPLSGFNLYVQSYIETNGNPQIP